MPSCNQQNLEQFLISGKPDNQKSQDGDRLLAPKNPDQRNLEEQTFLLYSPENRKSIKPDLKITRYLPHKTR